ncbi:MAG: hypothetical protein NTZ44_00310 [Candidatus Nomurabacteria bacterium]|nr:hypothetical protein [Candidatus Nomurabacteria bacterium]
MTANGGISIGAQALTGTTGIIDYTNFDVDALGNVTLAGALTKASTYSLNTSGVLTLKGAGTPDITTFSTAAGTNLTISPSAPSLTGAGVNLNLTASDGTTTGKGGIVNITSGAGAGGSAGGAFHLNTGASSGQSGSLDILTGNSSGAAAGNIAIDVGTSVAGNGTINIATVARTQTVNIGTNATGGVITVGSSSNTGLVLQDAQWSVTDAGAGSFASVASSGAIAANGGITFDNSTDTLGAHTLGGTVDASTQIITNIGNAGTDFVAATGALTLAGILTANGGISIGAQALTGTTGIIDYTNFDVAADGNITVAASKGIDTNGAGALQIGKANATSVDLCNSATCDTIGIGNLAATDADAITIGDVLDTTAINSTGSAESHSTTLQIHSELTLSVEQLMLQQISSQISVTQVQTS